MTDPIRTALLRLAVAALASTTTPALAQDENPVGDYRESFMKALAGHISDSYLIVSGEVGFDDQLIVHARAMAEQAPHIDELFPQGSGGPETRALPAIWQQWAEFEQAAARAEQATRDFLATVEGQAAPADIAAGFKAVGDACKGCHEKYRAEEE